MIKLVKNNGNNSVLTWFLWDLVVSILVEGILLVYSTDNVELLTQPGLQPGTTKRSSILFAKSKNNIVVDPNYSKLDTVERVI